MTLEPNDQLEGTPLIKPSSTDHPLHEAIVDACRTVFDPEIPVNIYDLGLIYKVDVGADGVAEVEMTLTTPGCPVAQTFPGEVEAKVRAVPGVHAAHVELVWEPPWCVDNMTDDVKLELGLL